MSDRIPARVGSQLSERGCALALSELPTPPDGRSGWPWNRGTECADASCCLAALPRISIVIPSYNQAAFIEETIRSILLQNYANLELIIIDGGSQDGSPEIIARYAPWLAYWVSEPDGGQSCAINKGFSRSTGEIVTFTGSDDIYFPGTLLDVAAHWSELQGYGAIVGSFYYMNEHSVLTGQAHPPRMESSEPIDLTMGPPGIYRLHQAATFYTMRALEDVGFWVREDLKYTMDRDLLYRVCRKHRVLLRRRPYGAFRTHETSKSSCTGFPFQREFARLHLLYQNGNEQEDRQRRRMARLRLAKGYLSQAKKSNNRIQKSSALLHALRYWPEYALNRGYWARWVRLVLSSF